MASSATQDILRVVTYLAPFLTFGWYLVTSLYSVFTLQNLDAKVRPRTRRAVFIFESAIAGLFAAEAGTIIYQLFHKHGALASTPTNIYALSQALVYSVLPILLWGNDKHQWYPHYGAWMITLALDILTSGLLSGMTTPESPAGWAQISIRGARIITVGVLLGLFFAIGQSIETATDEEQEPLLTPAEPETPPPPTYGTNDAEKTAEGHRNEALDKTEKELKDKIKKLEERLKEHGNWFTYIKGYAIFVPLIWPKDQPWLKINMIGVGLCILAERALVALKPLGLGAVANYLAQGDAKGAFIALGVYGVLRWLDSPAGLNWLRCILWVPVESNAYIKLDTAAYDHVMSLSCDFHDSKQSGELHKSISQGSSVVTLLESLLYSIAPQIVDLIVAGFYLYFLFDAYLVLLAAATVVLFLTFSMGRSGHQQSLVRRRNASSRHQYQVMYDTIGGWRTVIYFNQSNYASKMYDASVRLAYKAWRVLDLFWYGKRAIESLIVTVASIAAFAYAVYSVVYGGKTVGSFVALQLYWTSFTGQLPQIPYFQRQLLKELVNAEELLQLLKTKPTVQDGPNEFDLKEGLVEFDRVFFQYSESKQIIHDLTFHARPGQTIAIVGETGAGKSTILKLLFRFYDVTQGEIKIDGQDIRNVTLQSLRDGLGVVPQDPTLFNDTVMANVRYAKLDATDEEIVDACIAAAVHDKIMTFKQGYATKVGERGIKLSGGELQRIAIARAILKNPKIILLDEATSSVDTDTEMKIQAALASLTSGRTTFVVAHRLSTIQNADRIIVVDDGTIVEQGTLKQLIKLKGKFHNLWTKQINLLDTKAASESTGEVKENGKIKENAEASSSGS